MTVVGEPREGAATGRRRRRGRRTLRAFSNVLILAGVLLLLDAGLTVFWQEPVSGVYAVVQQGRLDDHLKALDSARPTPAEARALKALPDPTRRIAFAARALNRKAVEGDAIGRIRIPRIGLSKVIVEGTGTDDLRKGPGHYPDTPLPGAPGTVGIAGHRTTYGAPFRTIDKVRKGDRVIVEMPYATVTYRVEDTRIVQPTDTWVVDRKRYDRLVLTACHPLYSAAQRIVVFARKVSAQPRGALR